MFTKLIRLTTLLALAFTLAACATKTPALYNFATLWGALERVLGVSAGAFDWWRRGKEKTLPVAIAASETF